MNIAVSSYHENIDPRLSSTNISEFNSASMVSTVADSAIEYAETKIKKITNKIKING